MTPGSLPRRFGALGSRSFLLGSKRVQAIPSRPGKLWNGETLHLLLIAIFGAVGTLARYGLQGLVQVRAGSAFPYGTLLINLSGCFFLGMIGQFTMNRIVLPPDWRPAITVGFLPHYSRKGPRHPLPPREEIAAKGSERVLCRF